MAKAYSYIRFSTPEQARGDSLRRQTAGAATWCAEKGIDLDDTLRDLGVSAWSGANRTGGALRSFLEMVEKGSIERGSYLIVESLDRLSRETVIDAATQLFSLIQAGVTVVTLHDKMEYSYERLRKDWTPLIISLSEMARSHDESEIKSKRVGDAWRKKKELARTSGNPVTSRCPEWLYIENGRFQRNPDRVKIVKRIFEETIVGYGRREIVRRLNNDGILPFRHGENRERPSTGWQTSSIAKIVQNRMVLGEYQPHTGTHKARNRRAEGAPISDYYPAIIDEKTYWRAQAAIHSRRNESAGRRGVSGAHILRGLAKCAVCGGPMHIVNKGRPPKGGVYLSCDRNRRNAGCNNDHSWRVDKLEDTFLLALACFETKAFSTINGAANHAADKLAALEAQLADLQKLRDRLLAIYETGDDKVAQRFSEVSAQVQAKQTELKAEQDQAKRDAADPDDFNRLLDTIKLATALRQAGDDGVRDLRIRLSALVRKVVKRVDCDPIRGAIMVLPLRKYWSVKSPNEGFFAFRPEEDKFVLLLDCNPDDEAVDRFFRGKGGLLLTTEKVTGIPPLAVTRGGMG